MSQSWYPPRSADVWDLPSQRPGWRRVVNRDTKTVVVTSTRLGCSNASQVTMKPGEEVAFNVEAGDSFSITTVAQD